MRVFGWQIRRVQSVPVAQPILPGLILTEDLAGQHLSAEARTVIARVCRGMVKDLLGDLSEHPEKIVTGPLRSHIEDLARAAANEAIIGKVFKGINVLEVGSDANLVPQQRTDGAFGLRTADPAGDPPADPAGS